MDQTISNIFHEHGYSLTKPRQAILNVLLSSPLSIQEVYGSLLSQEINIDLATIYRTLELLTTFHIVTKTQFEDKAARYELALYQEHHHHLVCEKCGSVEDMPLDEELLLQQIETKSSFKVKKHSLEFFGYCKQCQ